MGNGRQGPGPGQGHQGGTLQTDGMYNESSSTVNRQSYFQLGRAQPGTVPESEITVRVTCKHLAMRIFIDRQWRNIIIIIIIIIIKPHSHFSRSLLRHWDRSTNLLLTSSASWAVGSPPNFMKSDRPHICSRECQSRCNDIMQLFCTTAFHQDRTSGHQWISF